LQIEVLADGVECQFGDFIIVEEFCRNGEDFVVEFEVGLRGEVGREHFEDGLDDKADEFLVSLVVKIPKECELGFGRELLIFLDDDFFEDCDVFKKVLNNIFLQSLNLSQLQARSLFGVIEHLQDGSLDSDFEQVDHI
jgi:hypothetical protein